jgi:N-acetyl-gamma-glutamyl-phosphate reductase
MSIKAKTKIFIDGGEGTTGLKIKERFEKRTDIEILEIKNELRKDDKTRSEYINAADFVFLCLPDSEAIKAVSMCKNPSTRIIDGSTAHRINKSWVYGLPELSPNQTAKIKAAKRVSVPGCYATGFISLIYPLVSANIVQQPYPMFCYAISGYSGAGKKAIAQYNEVPKPVELTAPRLYALDLNHKHLPEMRLYSGLSYTPMFSPVIDDYFSGMVVVCPITPKILHRKTSLEHLKEIYTKHYENRPFVNVIETTEDSTKGAFLSANMLADTNKMEIFVLGNKDQFLLVARFDNLGKGASGAAVQCLNLMMGIEETTGLI